MKNRPHGKEIKKEELEFLKQILLILLSGEGSCVHGVDSDGYARSSVEGPQHFAGERLIKEFESGRQLANLAVSSYLDRFDHENHLLLRGAGALDYAYRIAYQFPVSALLAERLLKGLAHMGQRTRLEDCARRWCNRGPTPEEVRLLIKSYVDGPSQCNSIEEDLAACARKYMPPDQAKDQLHLLSEYNREFCSSSGY